jgi:GT2 family glycosyltransferase
LGIAHSQADIVAFTDADCIADPRWLEELVLRYANPQIGGVGGKVEAYRHAERNLIEKFSDEHSPLVNFISGDGEFLPHLYTANASYRRLLVEQVGKFNSKIVTGEDVDLSWRIQLHTGKQLDYNENACVYHHHRSTREKLAKQYRQYGFGEILLDTIYGQYPDYPRSLEFQIKRIGSQGVAVVRYIISIFVREVRRRRGLIPPDEALTPRFMLMKTTQHLFNEEISNYIERFY